VFLEAVEERQQLHDLALSDRVGRALAREEGELAERGNRRRESAPADEDTDGPGRPFDAALALDLLRVPGQPLEERPEAARVAIAEPGVVLPAVREEDDVQPRLVGSRRFPLERFDQEQERLAREEAPLVVELEKGELVVVVDLERARLDPFAALPGREVLVVDGHRHGAALRIEAMRGVRGARGETHERPEQPDVPHPHVGCVVYRRARGRRVSS